MTDQIASWLGYIALALSLYGAYLNARKRISGFYIWIISNAFWMGLNGYIYFKGNTEILSQIFMFFIYTLLNFYGIYEWKKKEQI